MYSGTRTCGAILERRAAEFGGREIIRFDDGALTYGELNERATRIANSFAGLDLSPGDTVAVQLPNGPAFVSIWFGLARAGIVEVPLNVGLRGDLLAHTLNQARCRAIVIADEWLSRIDAIAADLVTLEHVVVVGEGQSSLPTTGFAEVLNGSASAVETAVNPWDRAVVLFTSGTTGPSKGVLLTHEATFSIASSMIQVNELEETERLFTAFPLFHTNARYASVVTAMMLDNGSAVLHKAFSASRFWDICRAERATVFNFMGALLLMLLKQPEQPNDADNPVRKGWGAPAPADITPDFERRFGVVLSEGYGLTETGIVASATPSARRLGSCGKPVDDFEIQVHDEFGNPVEAGTVGEIVMRPRKPHILFEEYYNMPEATLEAFRGLWFHTGDRGRFDSEGWLYFVDRSKEAIRRRGENISSWEVEQVLNTHESVHECAVIGVPSDLTEEEVLAVVRLKEGHDLAPERLLDFVQERLPHFAVPRYVRFVSALPKNTQQRTQKFLLREQGLTDDDWDRESVGYVVKR